MIRKAGDVPHVPHTPHATPGAQAKSTLGASAMRKTAEAIKHTPLPLGSGKYTIQKNPPSSNLTRTIGQVFERSV